MTEDVNWREYIVSDPKVLGGKPRVRETRLAVEFILGLFAEGWTIEETLREYPGLDENAIKAVFAYAADVVGDEVPAAALKP